MQEYKCEIERLQREMNAVKKKYFEQKREAHLEQQASRAASPPGAGVSPPPPAPALKQVPVGAAAAGEGPADMADLIPAVRSSASAPSLGQASPVAAGGWLKAA